MGGVVLNHRAVDCQHLNWCEWEINLLCVKRLRFGVVCHSSWPTLALTDEIWPVAGQTQPQMAAGGLGREQSAATRNKMERKRVWFQIRVFKVIWAAIAWHLLSITRGGLGIQRLGLPLDSSLWGTVSIGRARWSLHSEGRWKWSNSKGIGQGRVSSKDKT